MNTIRKLMTVVACVASINVVGCTKAPTSTPSDVGPNYVAPGGTGATTFDGIDYKYVATAEREAQIIGGFPKLKVGQSREEVRGELGLPDTTNPEYGKEYNSPFLGWYYVYKIKMRASSPNMNDVCVEVFFNPAGELKWAVPGHIAGLKEVGGPAGP